MTATLQRQPSLTGMDPELTRDLKMDSIDLMGNFVAEADPIALVKAIALVNDRTEHPGSDRLISSPAKRAALLQEIYEEWKVQTDTACDDDDFYPYQDWYVLRKWVDFRKMPNPRKQAWIAAAKRDQ
jgi:hypothetical protein